MHQGEPPHLKVLHLELLRGTASRRQQRIGIRRPRCVCIAEPELPVLIQNQQEGAFAHVATKTGRSSTTFLLSASDSHSNVVCGVANPTFGPDTPYRTGLKRSMRKSLASAAAPESDEGPLILNFLHFLLTPFSLTHPVQIRTGNVSAQKAMKYLRKTSCIRVHTAAARPLCTTL